LLGVRGGMDLLVERGYNELKRGVFGDVQKA